MKISVAIPVYNEVKTILSILEKLLKNPIPLEEIVVVDDGSFDGTVEQLKRVDHPKIKIFYHASNQGKGAALKTAFSKIKGDVVIVQDADLEYDPEDYPILLEPILQGKADVVYGSRFVGSQAHRVVFFWHMVGNKILTFLSNMFSNLNLTDMETGFKVFRKIILDQIQLEEKRFGFEPEITAKVARLKCRIFEVGISYAGRTYEDGKKITWRDGFSAIRAILKYNCFR
jgi:glycosyltransferase involved in cell wall biosynthesis